VAVDYPRAMAAYKVGAEGGDASCQWQVGMMYCNGEGVDVDYTQALSWLEKAAAQDDPDAVGQLGAMYCDGLGVTPSWRRAREHFERAVKLGNTKAAENMQILTGNIQAVTSERSHHPATSRTPPTSATATHLPSFLHTYRSPPSWTSGWSSTARAGRT